MIPSKVTVSPETIAKAEKKLTRKERATLKIDRLLDFVATKENGHPFKLKELIESMGYDPAKQYGTAWAFLKSQAKKSKRFTLEEVTGEGWSVYTRSAKTVTVKKPVVVTETPEAKKEDFGDVIFIQQVREKAKDFAWQNNSDSLREFISSLF
jgi:translation initiation factor 2 alpha subunit (eIF-2alpha)